MGRKKLTEQELAELKPFKDIAKRLEDSFWRDQINSFSQGSFPRYFNYHDRTLYYKEYKREQQSYTLTGDTVRDTQEIIEMFRDLAGIKSSSDIRKQEQYLKDERNNSRQTWFSCSFHRKYKLLREYLMNKGASSKELSEIGTELKLLILTDVFTSKNVKLENGKVTNVTIIKYSESNGIEIDYPEISTKDNKLFDYQPVEQTIDRNNHVIPRYWKSHNLVPTSNKKSKILNSTKKSSKASSTNAPYQSCRGL